MTTNLPAVALLFLAFLCPKTPTLAQNATSPGSPFRLGIRAGGSSVLPLETVKDATYHPTVSYHGGLMLSFGRGCFTFQPEVNLSQRHIRADFNQQGIGLSAKVMTDRLEVPLLAKATFGQSNARFFINAGPYGAYILSERYQARLLSYSNPNPNLRPIIEKVIAGLNNQKATFNGSEGRFSYGLAGGLGVAFTAGPGQLILEGRALYELGDNTPPEAADPSGLGVTTSVRDTKYSLLQASIGYLIPLGGR